jgi:hypothetical protein
MARMGKYLSLLIIGILAVSLLVMVKPIDAQTIPKPSVPEFTVFFADHSYDVPLTSTNSTNPYTGQQETHTEGGYHVEIKTIDVKITNQQFTPITIDGNTTQLYYVIRWKGYYENWPNISYSGMDYNYYLNNFGINASNSQYTLKSYPIASMSYIPNGGKIDFQVKAQAGYPFRYFGGHIQPIGTNFHAAAESEWSNIQTVTMVGNAWSNSTSYSPTPTESPNPTPSPSVPEFSWLMILPLFLSILSIAVLIKKRKFDDGFD